MINFDNVTGENIKKHYPNQPHISKHSYRILMIRGSGSGKRNTLLSLINPQPDIDKTYLQAKDPYETKCQLLINKHESIGLKDCNGSKTFIKYSNGIDNYENITGYNPNKKQKLLIVLDHMIANLLSKKKSKNNHYIFYQRQKM